MTKKLFREDPYLRTLETVVESVLGNAIPLGETIFTIQGLTPGSRKELK